MPLPILPSVFRVALTKGSGIGAATNVIHVSSATLTPAQVLTALDGAIAVGTFDAQAASLTTVQAVCTKLDNTTPSIEATLSGAGWAGTGAGEVSPASAVVVTFKTSQRGRRHTGRLFMGNCTEDKIGNGQAAAVSQPIMQAAWTTTLANLVSAGIPLNVASYGKTSVPPDAATDFPPTSVTVTNATVQNFLGTQRRRQSRLRS